MSEAAAPTGLKTAAQRATIGMMFYLLSSTISCIRILKTGGFLQQLFRNGLSYPPIGFLIYNAVSIVCIAAFSNRKFLESNWTVMLHLFPILFSAEFISGKFSLDERTSLDWKRHSRAKESANVQQRLLFRENEVARVEAAVMHDLPRPDHGSHRHNGAGKSTLIKILTGEELPDEGTAHIGGCLVTNSLAPSVAPEVGSAPVRSSTPSATRSLAASDTSQLERARGMLRDSVSENKEDVLSCDLSGGQKGSTILTLLATTGRLFLDEPRADWTRCRAAAVEEKSARSIILCTQFMDEADILADRKIFLCGGKIVCAGSSMFSEASVRLQLHAECVAEVQVRRGVVAGKLKQVRLKRAGETELQLEVSALNSDVLTEAVQVSGDQQQNFGFTEAATACVFDLNQTDIAGGSDICRALALGDAQKKKPIVLVKPKSQSLNDFMAQSSTTEALRAGMKRNNWLDSKSMIPCVIYYASSWLLNATGSNRSISIAPNVLAVEYVVYKAQYYKKKDASALPGLDSDIEKGAKKEAERVLAAPRAPRNVLESTLCESALRRRWPAIFGLLGANGAGSRTSMSVIVARRSRRREVCGVHVQDGAWLSVGKEPQSAPSATARSTKPLFNCNHLWPSTSLLRDIRAWTRPRRSDRRPADAEPRPVAGTAAQAGRPAVAQQRRPCSPSLCWATRPLMLIDEACDGVDPREQSASSGGAIRRMVAASERSSCHDSRGMRRMICGGHRAAAKESHARSCCLAPETESVSQTEELVHQKKAVSEQFKRSRQSGRKDLGWAWFMQFCGAQVGGGGAAVGCAEVAGGSPGPAGVTS
uniref:ABC transporter domain-containing protein n=1 Tax=Macrostomum lignano TaxID=282301 RepID=A0A1I8F1P4_9PLAT